MTDPRVRRISFVTGGMTCWSVCTLASAHAEKRVALVVGNAAYRYTNKLDKSGQ